MVTFWILFETPHFNLLLQVTLWLNSQTFSRKLMSNLVCKCDMQKWVPFCFELTWSIFSIKIMDNFKFSLLLRGQLGSLSIDNNISSFLFKMLPCYEEFFFLVYVCIYCSNVPWKSSWQSFKKTSSRVQHL